MLQKHADMLRTLQRLLSIPGVATGPPVSNRPIILQAFISDISGMRHGTWYMYMASPVNGLEKYICFRSYM